MGQILLKFDNQLKQSEIVIPLTNSSVEEAGDNYVYNKQGIQQTSIYGILTPLIQINNIVVDFLDVESFSLKSIGPLPSVQLTVKDRYNLTSILDTPGSDNKLRVQILPQFDDAYKKINLTFYISKINISGETIDVTGVYKSADLMSSKFKCLGELSTYELCEKIAKETQLGFATNVEEISDKRYMYCNYISYNELLNNEIRSSASDATHIYDWWVDLWNNINLVNIYERYNTIDPEEELQIWVSGQQGTMLEGVKVQPHKITANLNNHPTDGQMELKVDHYDIVNKPGAQVSGGTDKVYSVYMVDLGEYKDTLIQDGDVKKDIFINCEYLGEVYGEYNYLLAEVCRDAYLQKMGIESVKVTIKTPLLALMRGHKVNFTWYTNNSQYDRRLKGYEELGLKEKEIKTVFPLNDDIPEDEIKYDPTYGDFVIDKSISGQYMITGCDISYSNGEWEYELTLNRPISHKPKILDEEKLNKE